MEALEYYCKKCSCQIEDIAKAMLEGCACGSRIFKKHRKGKSNLEDTSQSKENLVVNEDVAIHVKQKGIYQLNLENLTKRESDNDPIFVQDSKGKINVIFNPDA